MDLQDRPRKRETEEQSVISRKDRRLDIDMLGERWILVDSG